MDLRILTFNINKSRDWLFRKSSRENLKSFIIDVDADVVFLQEFSGVPETEKTVSNELEQFADEIWQHFVYARNSVYQKGHHGNAILSKFPILNWRNIDISTNRYEKRGLLCAKIILPMLKTKIDIDLFCVHLDLLQRGRNIQVKKIIEEISGRSQSVPFILAGDFNDWNLKLDLEIKKQLDVQECGMIMNNGKVLKTFPSLFPFLSLDRIYVEGLKPDTNFKSFVKCKDLLSDHMPVVTQVKLDV